MAQRLLYKTPITPINTPGVPASGLSEFPAAEDHDHGITTSSNHSLLDGSVHPDTVAQVVSRGSLIYGNSTPKWDELVIGGANTILGSDGTDAAWRAQSFLDHGSIGGLADDDHALYLLASDATNRATFAANWTDLTDGGATILHSHAGGSGMAIGGTVTSGTAGSVLFVATGPVLAQDNADFFWDDTNNRLGIGTATPADQLELTGALRLAAFTTSTAGMIKQGADTLLHTLGRVSDGGFSCFVGRGAGNLTNTGFNNTGVGEHALASITSGAKNTAVGRYALASLTTGDDNIAIGSATMGLMVTGNTNVGIGAGVLVSGSFAGSAIVAIGSSALSSLTTGVSHVAIGEQASNLVTTASYNTAIGSSALLNATGGINTAIGAFALTNLTTGTDNVAIGMNAGIVLTTGDHCTFIGRKADASANNLTYATAIGSFATVANSSYIMLGGGSNECVGINGAGKPSTGTGGLIFGDGTALATMASNTAGIYADDISGNVSMHAINENGDIIKLYQQANTVALDDLVVNNGMRASGGVALFTAQFKFVAGNETTGGGTALLGTNSPAVTNTAPYTWLKVTTSDGSQGYVPVWK